MRQFLINQRNLLIILAILIILIMANYWKNQINQSRQEKQWLEEKTIKEQRFEEVLKRGYIFPTFLPQEREIFSSSDPDKNIYKDYQYNFEITYPSNWKYIELEESDNGKTLEIYFSSIHYDHAYKLVIDKSISPIKFKIWEHPEIELRRSTSKSSYTSDVTFWPIYRWLNGILEFKYPPLSFMAPSTISLNKTLEHPLRDCLKNTIWKERVLSLYDRSDQIYYLNLENKSNLNNWVNTISNNCPNISFQVDKTSITTPNPVYRIFAYSKVNIEATKYLFYSFQSGYDNITILSSAIVNEDLLEKISSTVKTFPDPKRMVDYKNWEIYTNKDKMFTIKYPVDLKEKTAIFNNPDNGYGNWLVVFGHFHELPPALTISEYSMPPTNFNRLDHEFIKTYYIDNKYYVFSGNNTWENTISKEEYQLIFDNFVNSFTKL